jgi:FAD/FMN-containing dehydrogenase
MGSASRRSFVCRASLLTLLPGVWPAAFTRALALGPLPVSNQAGTHARRCRAGDPEWPSEASWAKLNEDVGGRLIKLQSPLAACRGAADSASCAELFKQLKNPYFIGDQPALTQTSGWAHAWASSPSVYAVAAQSTADVVVAVNFAREHNVRLVVKGGGHSYQGTSNAPDSLLVWTHPMNDIVLHDHFVPRGCEGLVAVQPAVTIGAGAIWMHTYQAVTTQGGRYVQGGGCATVGVAGLVQSGGFGSFSKQYGTAAAGLLEAEVVTADGAVRLVNAGNEPDLFWALKGGGGGSLGVVTRLTLRTRELPPFFGAVTMKIVAKTDAAFHRLTRRFADFYATSLFNPHWGEQARFGPGNRFGVLMTFQGIDEAQARETWGPFLDWIADAPDDYTLASPAAFFAAPARHFWDPVWLKRVPGIVLSDDRPGAPVGNIFWAGNLQETGQFLYAYESVWLPASLLDGAHQSRLADALFAASRHWSVTLHFNKGLAGAPTEAIESARDTAMNPAVLDAFALAISGAEGPPAFAGIAGHEPDLALARQRANALHTAMREIVKLAPAPASYVSEGNYFDAHWQQSFWGPNYARLRAVKQQYDPGGLFIVHHGVGSEAWSADGFTRARSPAAR